MTTRPSTEPGSAPGSGPLRLTPQLEPKMAQLRRWLAERLNLAASLDGQEAVNTPEAIRQLTDRFNALLQQTNLTLPDEERTRLRDLVFDDVIGYGPLGPLLRDPTISEIMVNKPDLIYIEKEGRLLETDVRFENADHIMRIAERIVRPLGRTIDRKRPMVDARLPDGSRVNIIIPPSALAGPTMTIRKFPARPLTVDDLLRFGSITPALVEFLRACVAARLNIVVAGGTGSGKTTLLNVLSSFIPEGERIVTIEDSAELQLQQRHVVRMETTPADADGTGRVTVRDLVVNSLRMRPDRIIVGEVRAGEALDMLQAMNTGHDGSLTTVHANSPRDVISRLETMALMAGITIPVEVIRRQIASAIDLIVLQGRLRGGVRKVLNVTEVQGMEGETVVLQDIFIYRAPPFETEGAQGSIQPTGLRPKFMRRLEDAGFRLSAEVFGTTAGEATNGPRQKS